LDACVFPADWDFDFVAFAFREEGEAAVSSLLGLGGEPAFFRAVVV